MTQCPSHCQTLRLSESVDWTGLDGRRAVSQHDAGLCHHRPSSSHRYRNAGHASSTQQHDTDDDGTAQCCHSLPYRHSVSSLVGQAAEYCDGRVCLSVCLSARNSQELHVPTSPNVLRIMPIHWPWLGPNLVPYMYFRFCG